MVTVPRGVRICWGTTALLAVVLVCVCWLFVPTAEFGAGDLAILLGIAILSDIFAVRLPKGEHHVTITFPIVLAAILMFGPAVGATIDALAVFAGGIASKHVLVPAGRREYGLSWLVFALLFNACQLACCSAIAGMIYLGFGGTLQVVERGIHLVPIALCSAAYLSISFVLSTWFTVSVTRETWGAIWRSNVRGLLINVVALIPLGLLLTELYVDAGKSLSIANPTAGKLVGVMILFVPLLVLRQALLLRAKHARAYRQSITTLGALMQAFDPYTGRHVNRVAETAVRIAEELGMSDLERELLHDAALLHDLGKIPVGEEIVDKNGSLTTHEWERIREHPAIGADIISRLRHLEPTASWVRAHHERPDGRGYPNRLKDGQIPIAAAIIAAADAYDAMTGGWPRDTMHRPYAAAIPRERALHQMLRAAGSQFDRGVVEALVRIEERRGVVPLGRTA
jgi:putative nucleotidyltransferase with HDIG domain